MKHRFLVAMEQIAADCRRRAAERRTVTAIDPVADAFDYDAAAIEEKIRALHAPTIMLTPAEWGAEQEPVRDESTVRRWCDAGELEHERIGRLYRIPAGAVRVKRELPALQHAS
jgi:hypothetical protein